MIREDVLEFLFILVICYTNLGCYICLYEEDNFCKFT